MSGNRLKDARKLAKRTQQEAASLLGVSLDTIWRLESGKREPKVDEVFKLAKLYDVDFNDLMPTSDANANDAPHISAKPTDENQSNKSNVTFPGRFVQIPVLSMEAVASCGAGNGLAGVEAQTDDTIFIEQSDLRRYDDLRKPFAIHTDGDSMEGAGLEEGSLAVVNPAEDVISGDMALVVWNDNWFIKWVVWNPDGSAELRSANPNYGPVKVDKEYAADVNWFRVVGKVVSIVRRIRPRRAF